MKKEEPSSPTDSIDYGARELWDSAHIPPRERFSIFCDVLCKTILNVSHEKPKNLKAFSARIERVGIERRSISRIIASPDQDSRRTKQDVAKIKKEQFTLHFQLAGESVVNSGGPDLHISTKNMFFIQSHMEWSFHSLGPQFSVMSLLVDRDDFVRCIGSDIETTGLQLNSSPMAPALLACLSSLNQHYLSASMQELPLLYDAAVAILGAIVLKDTEFLRAGHVEHTLQRGLLMTIKNYIDRNPANSKLSPTFIAKEFGLSVRYVHKLFVETDMSFQEYVFSRRLERICANLQDPFYAHVSISEIAKRWSFGDMSNFHRRFKTKYGTTPGEFRAQGKTHD